MAEGTYEYECQRAELLGLERPDYDEFVRNQKDREVTEEQIDVENLKVCMRFFFESILLWDTCFLLAKGS